MISTVSRTLAALVLAVGLVNGAQAAATDLQDSVPLIDLSGSWHGRWESCSSGHQGPLNATFCRLDPLHYRVDFRGRFFKILPFHYSVTLAVTGQEGGRVKLSGDSFLGRLFGWFHYEADATCGTFVANYTSCKDRGRFTMSRGCR
jgi:hypothetical protein